MFNALLLAVLTGVCWTTYGIILSFTAREKRDVVLFGLVQNFCCLLLALVIFVKWSNLDWVQALKFTPLVLLGGALNAIGQFITNRAMQKGHNGIAWAISQSSMIVPFIVAAVCFGKTGTISQWLGVTLILAGIIVPNLPEVKKNSGWLFASLAAFLLFGAVQTLYVLPSYWQIADPANLRPAAVSLGVTMGWGITAAVTRHHFKVQKSLIYLGCIMSLMSITSLLLFFKATDLLSKYDLGNIAVPLMVGSNILAFTLFSIFTIREKCSRKELTTIAFLLLGLFFLAEVL